MMIDKLSKATELSAQAWCFPETRHIEMIPELCEAFAYTLDPILGENYELKQQLAAYKEVIEAVERFKADYYDLYPKDGNDIPDKFGLIAALSKLKEME